MFLTVFSNVTGGETLEFRAWDASRGRLLKGLTPDDIEFIGSGIIGSRGAPIPIKATVLTQLTYELNPGWNWISFPLTHSDLSDVNDVLKELSPTVNDEIKNRDQGSAESWSYSGSSWLGTIPGVTTNLGYKIFLTDRDTFRYEGTFMDPSTEPIRIVENWNYIGVKSEFIIDVPSALASLDPQTGDVIKGQRSFAIYEDGFGWGGNLDFLQPQEGYMLKYHRTDSLYFPGSFNTNSINTRPESRQKSLAHKSNEVTRVEQKYNFVSGEFSSNMSLTAEIDACIALASGDEELDLSQWTLAAFADEECRGIVSSTWVSSLGKYLFYLTIDGSGSMPLTFKLIHNVNLTEVSLSETFDFVSNETVGRSTQPFQFTCQATNDCIESNLYQSADIDVSQDEITQRVVNSLRSDAKLPAPRRFIFKAGQSIELILGFEVENQATLEAYIEDCIKSN